MPIPKAIEELPRVVEQYFSAAQDEIAGRLASRWKGEVVAVGAVDSSTYLDAIAPGQPVTVAGERTILVEAPGARSYSDVVERGWKGRGQASYPGRYPAKRAVEAAEGDIAAALDEAGSKVDGW